MRWGRASDWPLVTAAMKLVLDRLDIKPVCAIGSLTVDGEWCCWTLEDTVRSGPKVPGMTAIPAGTYVIDITWSPRFARALPILLDVPNFSGVRIHPGNFAKDTEGCILPGLDRYQHSVGRSRLAFDALFVQLREARQRGEAITLEIG